MLTPKEGKVVEPMNWGKDNAEGRWRWWQPTPPPTPSAAAWPIIAVGMGETSFLLGWFQ
jgi:hypothetical protein